MGNTNKRESRKEHGELFRRVVEKYRNELDYKNVKKPKVDPYQKISIFCRKRPLFKHEAKKNEYDIVTVHPNQLEICVHDCRMKADLKPENAFVQHTVFGGFDAIFDENAENDDVYNQTTKSLVEHVCLGGKGTCFMYGMYLIVYALFKVLNR